MSLLVTITDIARELNTTAATVSRALNNDPSISQKTKKLVTETAERLNYKRNKVASSLRLGKTGIIGVIVPSAEINFFGSVVHGIESIANENGYNILIYQSNESWEHEKKGIETFLSARVDGIMVSIAKNTNDYSHFLNAQKAKMPLVFFDRVNDDLNIDSVTINDYKGAYLSTQHLLDEGYTRIAHISGPQHLKIFNDRLRGYMDALEANGIGIDPALVYHGDVSIESGKAAVAHFLASAFPPDAIFAVEDFTALGAIKELKENNIRIPEDVGIIGFANETFGEHITPTLSTIDQQTVVMGKEAFTLLVQLINQKKNETKPVRRTVLEPIPVFRKSSSRLTLSQSNQLRKATG